MKRSSCICWGKGAHSLKNGHDGLELRPALAQDAALLCRWWNDGSIMAHAGFPQGLGTTAREVAAQLQADASSHRLLLLEQGCPVGEAVWRTAGEPGTAEIGIKLCVPSARGRGLGTQYLHRLLRYLFGPGGFRLVTLTTAAEKPARKACVRETGVCANGGVFISNKADAAGVRSAGIPAEKRNICRFMGTGVLTPVPFSYP